MNTKNLKKHLRYMVPPQMRLALIKEPGVKPQLINQPTDLERFVDQLKMYSDYVPNVLMRRKDQNCHLGVTPTSIEAT
jgi:hypothetical protein